MNPAKLAPEDVLRWLAMCDSGLALEQESAREDTEIYVSNCRRELELAAGFTLTAAAEGRIRLGAEGRSKRLEDRVGKRLKILGAKVRVPWKIPLYDGGIIDVWKMYIGSLVEIPQAERRKLLGAVGRLSNLLELRHWIAHGRYWKAPCGIDQYRAAVVADAVGKLYEALRKAAAYGGAMAFV